jgi:hypothetical protein
MKLLNINKKLGINALLSVASLAALIIGLVQCSADSECRKDMYVQMTANFHTIKNDTIKTYTMDSIWVKGIGNDSVIYNNTKSLTYIRLPLQKLSGTSRFAIRFNNVFDTLTFVHTNNQQYISLECGCMTTHTLDTVLSSHHKILKTIILNKNVINKQIENVQIFF